MENSDLVEGSIWVDATDSNIEAEVLKVIKGFHQTDVKLKIVDISSGEVSNKGFNSLYFVNAYKPKNSNLLDSSGGGKYKTFVIGIAGLARSGKDTLANHVFERLGFESNKAAFADPVKDMLKSIGITDIEGYKEKEHPILGVTSRRMMQTLGTEWGRDTIGEGTWINLTRCKGEGKKFLIISDVRFSNEADFVRENGMLLHVYGRGGIKGDHKSESGVPFKLGDFKIDNGCEVEYMLEQVDVLLKMAGVYDS